jgi:hypothetical protein
VTTHGRHSGTLPHERKHAPRASGRANAFSVIDFLTQAGGMPAAQRDNWH